jgi:hypothetical protein
VGEERASWRHPPLWLRWVLTVIGFAALTISVVIAIHSSNKGSTAADDQAAREADREGRILVAQDQAPHTRKFDRALTPQRALERAIAADMQARIRHHELSGPLKRERCTPTAQQRATRRALRCSVQAGDVSYPFLGVVDLRARHITWCKRDPPPTPTLDIPVSRRCRT